MEGRRITRVDGEVGTGALTETQRRIWMAVERGAVCDLADGDETHLSDVASWAPTRDVAPAWLADLLAGRAGARLHPRGLTLRGAHFVGEVDWVGQTLRIGVYL